MNVNDELIARIYGVENLDKVKRNMKEGLEEAKRRFLAKYPSADLSKFKFTVILKDNGNIENYFTDYKISDDESYDITSDTFQSNKK